MAAGAVSLRKSNDIVILSFCNIVKAVRLIIKYIEKTWINSDTFPPQTWNFLNQMSKFQPINNYAEGYNSRLAHKKKLGDHPNVYLFASVVKEELEEGEDDALY